jgi:heme-degrading monooxygenase HmoA
MHVVMINPFTVFEGREAEFLELWHATAALFRAAPGFVSLRLCVARADQPPGLSAPFTHVNIAEWARAEDYAAALRQPEIRRLGARYRAVCRFAPALYDIAEAAGGADGP